MKTLVVGFDGTSQGRDALALGKAFADVFGEDLFVAAIDELHPFGREMPATKDRAAELEATLTWLQSSSAAVSSKARRW